MGWSLDEHYLGDRDLTDSPALRDAARRAFALAGIGDPARELACAEISDHFDYQRGLWSSLLGLNFPNLNLSGGLARGVPPFVAGLDCLIEIVLRLREKPGMGLAHGCWGPAGQGQVVVVVGR
jgi:acetyl-CoA C-acetyltransferase